MGGKVESVSVSSTFLARPQKPKKIDWNIFYHVYFHWND